jgi:hypothetical protein
MTATDGNQGRDESRALFRALRGNVRLDHDERRTRMNRLLVVALLAGLTTPVVAQTAIKGIELSPADVARVDRQCDVLQFRESASSSGSNPPDEPAEGEIVADPSSYWSDRADGIDSALAKVNLDTLTIRDCRDAGFYRN